MHPYRATFVTTITRYQFCPRALLCVLFIFGASSGAAAQEEGNSESPDATARQIVINFDTLGTNVPVSPTQYPSARFTTSPGATVSTAYDAGYGGSYPNGIVATSSSWNAEDLYVNFPTPVSGLSFRVLGTQGGGSSWLVDIYSNNSYYTSIWFNGSPFGPTTVNLSGIPHITTIFIRYAYNCSPSCIFYYPLYYDDFTFTPEITANITNPRVSGGLDQTNQKSLVGANIVLQSTTTQSGGTYSWNITPTTFSYSSGSQSSSSVTIRPTATGTYTAKLTYTVNGATVTPTVNIDVIIPTLSQFSASMAPDELNRNDGCGGYSGVTHSIGCYIPGYQEAGIIWSATANIPSATYLSDPAESGIKFVQAVDPFIKILRDGNRDCLSGRVTEFGEHWYLDTDDPYNHNAHPPQYFSAGNSLTMGEFDEPVYRIENSEVNPIIQFDATHVDSKFETYVFYFTSNPVGRDPHHPVAIYQRAMALQGSSYLYARLAWGWNANVVFNYFSDPPTLLYTLESNTHGGLIEASGTNEIKSMAQNVAPLLQAGWVPCIDSPQTTNKIDGSKFYTAQLYVDFFERDPDPGGWNFWRSFITRCGFDAGCIQSERVHIAVAQMYSTEFLEMHPELAAPRGTHDYNRAFVDWCYRVFLQREPDDPPDNNCEGFNFWVNKLDNANPEDEEFNYWEMVRAFIESIEYRERPFTGHIGP
jgi:hypothetical protein